MAEEYSPRISKVTPGRPLEFGPLPKGGTMPSTNRGRALVASLLLMSAGVHVRAEAESPDLRAALDTFRFRNLGPFRAGAWITDIAVPDTPAREHLRTIYVAARNGGIFKSTNNGTTFSPIFDEQSHLSIGALAIAPSNPTILWAGTGEAYSARSSYSGGRVVQDHESWKGPSNGRGGKVTQDDWATTGTQDGMYNRVDPTDSRWLYNSFQFGGQHRVDQRLHTKTNIQPRAKAGAPPYRFNWITPLALSPHDPKVLYTGAQMLLRSRDRGYSWEEISGDLTTNDAAKIAATGPSIRFCTITTISESAKSAGVFWVGTDDGRVQVTEDLGRTFSRISSGLPQRPVNVIVEDPVNPRLLFAGPMAAFTSPWMGERLGRPSAATCPRWRSTTSSSEIVTSPPTTNRTR